MKYGYFMNDGRDYAVTTPHTPVPWHNYLFNPEHHVKVSQLLQGEAACLVPFERNYTRGVRMFYVRDDATGEVWSPNLADGGCWPESGDGQSRPSAGAADREAAGRAAQSTAASGFNEGELPEGFACIHGLSATRLVNRNGWCRAEVAVTVPLEGSLELWQVKLVNTSAVKRELSLFSAFLPETGGMGVKCSVDAEAGILYSHTFPYHVRYEDKEKYDACRNYVFMFADRTPDSWECSERRFRGAEGLGPVPAAVRKGSLTGLSCEGENPVGAMQHRFLLELGESAEVLIAAGCAGDPCDAVRLKALWTDRERAQAELLRLEDYWQNHLASYRISTPDPHLDHFINYWLKKQVAAMTETHRMSNLSCVRNELQDAIGFSMLDPEEGARYLLKTVRGQERNGYIRQYRMLDPIQSPTGLALLNHKDADAWLLLCACAIVHQTGSLELLDRQVGFADGGAEASLYEHLLLAVDYMEQDRGSHGLCLMGDGDWTDPINGAGRLGRGESAWTTMAFLYGVKELIPLAAVRGDAPVVARLERLAEELDTVINRECWDGEWYLAGYDDEGIPFGAAGDKEGQIFLNAQTWAVMSGAARGQRLAACLRAVDRLNTPSGPVVIWPSYADWDGRIGKISIKRQGTTENGSVYCHAALFKACADLMAGRPEEGFGTIMKTLPGSTQNPTERNLQPPLWVPNFYFGLMDSPNFGKSSLNHSTGTAAWVAWTVLERLLGVRATVNGLEVSPNPPREWQEYRVERMFKGSRYSIEFRRPEGSEEAPGILVDGLPLAGALLPWEPDKEYRVQVWLAAVVGKHTEEAGI